MANESAIIVPIPEVEPIVGPLQWQHDPSARFGVPAHITLLYPFLPAQIVGDAISGLRELCASIEAFPFAFTQVRRFPTTAYLHPDKAETFDEIKSKPVRMWPACKPYDGAFSDVIPHLTVDDRADSAILDAVEHSLRHHLPIKCVAREIRLMTSDDAGFWSTKASFELAVSLKGDRA